MCTDFGVGANEDKKELGCIEDFLSLKFDPMKIEACLPKEKLKKAIKRVAYS